MRGWVRRATASVSWLHDRGTTLAHQLDPMLPAMAPTGTALGDAVAALAAAAGAATRRLSLLAPPWQLIALLTGGRLLAPPARAG